MVGGREEKVSISVSSCWWEVGELHGFLWNRRVVETLKRLLGPLSSRGLGKPSTSVWPQALHWQSGDKGTKTVWEKPD